MATQSYPTADRGAQTIKVWDLPLRLFHWLLVATIALAFLSSESEGWLSRWHIPAGWTAAVLISFRILWGFVGGEHSRWSDFLGKRGVASHLRELSRLKSEPAVGHNPLGAISVVALLALIAAVIWTGAALGEAGEEVHETLAWILLGLVVLHVLAVVAMSRLSHENLVVAMITGRKRAVLHPDGTNATPPHWAGMFLTLLGIVAATYAILRIDPAAFQPRALETDEQDRFERAPAGNAGEDGDGDDHDG